MWKSNLQLTVKVYNINEGRNPEIMAKCEVLSQYSRFVSVVREASKKSELTDPELKNLFQKCIDEGILPDFLNEYGREAVNMLFEELKQEEAIEVSKAGERSRINQLIKLLIDAGRIDELAQSTENKDFQEKLLEEFKL